MEVRGEAKVLFAVVGDKVDVTKVEAVEHGGVGGAVLADSEVGEALLVGHKVPEDLVVSDDGHVRHT